MTSFVEQRLKEAISTLNHRVNRSVAAALEQNLGPAGGALTAQITFTTAPGSISPILPPAKAQVLGEVNVTKETNGVYPAEELTNAPPTAKGGSKEKEQPTEKQNPTGSEAPETRSPDLYDDLSVPTANLERNNEPKRKEAGGTHTDAPKSAVHPLFADSTSRIKTGTSAVITAKPDAMVLEQAKSADKTLPKRKANQRDETNKVDNTGGSDSSLSEEEKGESETKNQRRDLN